MCAMTGHFKGECPGNRFSTKAPPKPFSSDPSSSKPVALVSVTHSPLNSSGSASPPDSKSILQEAKTSEINPSYSPFISDGSVALLGEVPARILRDTGASQSLILADVLPFSPKSFSRDSVVIRGVAGHVVVPRHHLVLHSDFVSGEVVLPVVLFYSGRLITAQVDMGKRVIRR